MSLNQTLQKRLKQTRCLVATLLTREEVPTNEQAQAKLALYHIIYMTLVFLRKKNENSYNDDDDDDDKEVTWMIFDLKAYLSILLR